MIASLMCFAASAVNVLFIVANPTGAYLNWAAAVFCFGAGIANAVHSAGEKQ